MDASKSLSVKNIACIAVITSFASMSYELVIAQTLALLTDEFVLWESLCIGFFIAATGLGIFLYDHLVKKNTLDFFIHAETLLALTGLISLPLILFVHIYYRIYIVDYTSHTLLTKPLNWIMLTCQTPNVLIGVLSGFELRVLFEWFKYAENKKTQSQTLILVAYHFGSLLASVLFSIVLMKKIDPFYIAFFASVLNIFVCLYVSYPYGSRDISYKLISIFLLSMLYISSPYLWSQIKDLHVKNFYYNKITANIHDGVMTQTGPIGLSKIYPWSQTLPKVQRQYSPYQVIDLVYESNDDKEWKLFLDGHFQFSSKTERFYHETLAHNPIHMTKFIPKRILILGGGDGLLARELLKYKNVERIDLVEIDKDMLALGKTLLFSSLNAKSLTDPRMHIHLADAFTWLRVHHDVFDAIYMDFPYPYTFEGLKLYSVEFLSLAARYLSERGFAVMDIPIFAAGEKDWKEHVSALLHQAGFAKALAFEGDYSETFVLASKSNASFVTLPLTQMELVQSSHRDVNSILKPKRISFPDIWK